MKIPIEQLKASMMGKMAELKAMQYLKKQGLSPITSNFRSKFGEIDLIMLQGDCLVFIEVRFRSHDLMGQALETIDYHKQARVMKTAEFYLHKNPKYQHHFTRFDVVSFDRNLSEPNWIQSAFSLEG